MRNALHVVGAGAAAVPLFLYEAFSVLEIDSKGSLPLLIDIAAVGLVAAGITHRFRKSPWRAVILVRCTACGALLGAGLVGPMRIAPYAFGAALLFGVSAICGGAWQRGARTLSAGSVATAALLNVVCLWPFTLGRFRPAAEVEYMSLDLRIHSLMADTPLHDVWTVRFPGLGRDATVYDLDQALASYGTVSGDDRVALAAVLGAYFVVSRVFDWHNNECARPETSVRQRITEADRARPGAFIDQGPFVYRFEREAAIELQTCAAHAVYAYAIRQEGDGVLLYWAAYSLPVGWFTPIYLGTIDPVRKLIVFPSLLERFERAWRKRWVQ